MRHRVRTRTLLVFNTGCQRQYSRQTLISVGRFRQRQRFTFNRVVTTHMGTLTRYFNVRIRRTLQVRIRITGSRHILITQVPHRQRRRASGATDHQGPPKSIRRQLRRTGLVRSFLFTTRLRRPIMRLQLFLPGRPHRNGDHTRIKRNLIDITIVSIINRHRPVGLRHRPPLIVH